MTRDACNVQKFVQNIGLTIAWKSPPYPRLNINRRHIKPMEGGQGRYRISCVARDYGKLGKKIVTIYIYQWST